ncbi:hypothetical protein L873DRAFT_1824196 [Choiromyces venosus 120613-1]|uniref:Uncharacterized protein n=1 Tax=Choiromyces venosus 120613-1 TaxID=1336337 RepID=A0A3N4IR87_9PEZI|nr:hypothetical protein L873DRAFT_1824196 [Choiromyces venosus 120613-1]
MSDPISTPPFMVTKALSKVYYKGLPSQPPLIATTKPSPFEAPTGPEAYSVLKELRCLGDHPLTSVWDYGLAIQLCRSLTTMGVKWSCLDALHIANVGEPSGPAIVWIGVEFGALSFEEGSKVAINCHKLIDSHGIRDYYVEIRESRVMRQAGNRFFDPVPFSDPTFTAQDPYTATLGIPISIKDRPWAEGTGGFYLSAGGNDKNIYLVTARHVVLPVDNDGNKEYYHQDESKPREEVLVLGTSAFNNKLAAIDYEIRGQECAITDAKEGIESVQGMDDPKSVREYEEAEKDLEAAEKGLEALKALRHEIATHWMAKEKRVFGELTWAPPITLSTEPGQYTLDLAIIKINAGKLDANNYRGNTINIGKKYTRQEFMDKVYPHLTSPTSFKFPRSRLVKLEDQVPESTLVKLPMLDANGDPCLVVFKNGAMTGTTIGRANNVSSYTRNYFAGQYHESREWPVIPTDKYLGAFSTKGDSGSCVADAYGRVGGILTSGSGATDSSDVTYVTPISFIMKVLHDTRLFKHAHLNPALA